MTCSPYLDALLAQHIVAWQKSIFSKTDSCQVGLQVQESGKWLLLEPAMSTLKHAFAVEQTVRGSMRGLKSILREREKEA